MRGRRCSVRLKKGQKEAIEQALALLEEAERQDSQKIADEALKVLQAKGLNWLDVIEYQKKGKSK
jgi:hypothetical protein